MSTTLRPRIPPYRHVLVTSLLCAVATPAWAQEAGDPADARAGDRAGPPAAAPAGDLASKRKGPTSYFSTVFQGGILIPLSSMAEVHQSSLAGGLRIGWTGTSGLGIDVAAEYSPLSRKNPADLERSESHFVTAALMPRFTLGRKTFRLWLAAGGGASYERVRRFPDDAPQATENRYALTGSGALGLEFHPISGVGVTAIASYSRTLGQIEYELVNVTGGLVFTF